MKTALLLIFFLPLIGHSQNETATPCACCTKNHQGFDFWIGDWEVFNENGDKIGENLIQKLENNCIVSENWKGASGGTGKSYNYYDPTDDTWNQLWLSSSGTILKLKGKALENKIVLKSEILKTDKGESYNQITWTKQEDGSVLQVWEIMDAEGNLLNQAFKGIYRRRL